VSTDRAIAFGAEALIFCPQPLDLGAQSFAIVLETTLDFNVGTQPLDLGLHTEGTAEVSRRLA
jgi:hypothetical protein